MKKILQTVGLAALGITVVNWAFQKGYWYGAGKYLGALSVTSKFDDDPAISDLLNDKSCPFMLREGVKSGINYMHKKNES